MARNEEEKIIALEKEASQLGYGVEERSILIGELELSNQFRWIAGHLIRESMSANTPAQRKHVRQQISQRTKELSDVVQAKHIQYYLAFSCIDLHDECVRKRKRQKKRQKKSTYLCFLALYICLARSMTALLAAITAGAAAGGLLR